MHGYGNVLSFVHAHWLIFTYFKMHSVHCRVGSHAQSEFMQNVKFNIAGNVFQVYLFIIQSLKCVLRKYVFSYTKYYYKTLSLQLSHRSMVHPGATDYWLSTYNFNAFDRSMPINTNLDEAWDNISVCGIKESTHFTHFIITCLKLYDILFL